MRDDARRVAFLIGNSRFSLESGLTDLAGPGTDVKLLEELLRDPDVGGFEVNKFVDADSRDILAALEERLSQAFGKNDFILVYYSGHGQLDSDGRLCLATTDTRSAALRSTSVRVSTVREILHSSRAGDTLLLLDCCYSGAVGKEIRGTVDSEFATLSTGHHVFTSSTATQTSREEAVAESGEKMGAFTRCIVEGIRSGRADRDRDGVIHMSELRGYVEEQLRGQNPRYWVGESSGEPIIARTNVKARLLRVARARDRLSKWLREESIEPVIYAKSNAMLRDLDEEDPAADSSKLLALLEDELVSADDFTEAVVALFGWPRRRRRQVPQPKPVAAPPVPVEERSPAIPVLPSPPSLQSVPLPFGTQFGSFWKFGKRTAVVVGIASVLTIVGLIAVNSPGETQIVALSTQAWYPATRTWVTADSILTDSGQDVRVSATLTKYRRGEGFSCRMQSIVGNASFNFTIESTDSSAAARLSRSDLRNLPLGTAAVMCGAESDTSLAKHVTLYSVQIPEIHGRVARVRFYNSGYDYVEPAQRTYASTFTAEQLRYLNWEFTVEHPSAERARVPYQCTLTSAHGTIQPIIDTIRVAPATNRTISGWSWGTRAGGTYAPGTWLLTCEHNGSIIARDSFFVK